MVRRTAEPKAELELDVEHAEAIIEKGIEYGAHSSDEMPESKKEKLNAAEEIIAFSVDAWINDGITPDDENDDIAKSGRQIEEILTLAGVSIEDGEAVYGELPDLDGEEDDNSGDKSEGEPFHPDDYIEGYSELSVISKLKAVKQLDADDDDDAAVMEAIADWEQEQEKPSSRVLNYIEEALGSEEEAAEEEADEPEAEGEEPWDGYDKASATEIKKVLKEAKDADELTADQVEYVLEYEQAREKPPTRKRVVEYCNALLEELGNGDDSEPEAEDEPEPPKRGRGRRAAKPEPAASNGTIVLTRDQILAALADGEVEIEV